MNGVTAMAMSNKKTHEAHKQTYETALAFLNAGAIEQAKMMLTDGIAYSEALIEVQNKTLGQA